MGAIGAKLIEQTTAAVQQPLTEQGGYALGNQQVITKQSVTTN